MATSIEIIKGYLTKFGFGFKQPDDETIYTGYMDGEDRVFIVIQLGLNGEWLQIRSNEHLGNLVSEASPERRNALMAWMLHQNYTTKIGTWEYDPETHDHHIAVEHWLADNELTEAQFHFLLGTVCNTAQDVSEMKEVLGIPSETLNEADLSRQAMREQLKKLEEEGNTSI